MGRICPECGAEMVPDGGEWWDCPGCRRHWSEAYLQGLMQQADRLAALERDRDRILTEAVRALATEGFDAEWHGGEWYVGRNPQAKRIPDGAEDRLRRWLSGEGP